MVFQVARFGIVGMSALSVHWLTVAAMVPLGAHPLSANVAAFLVAFQVSYWGHRRWTFEAAALPHAASLPRFALIACSSFAFNQLLYFLMLRYTALDYRISLFVVLLAVAAMTFILSKRWVFR